MYMRIAVTCGKQGSAAAWEGQLETGIEATNALPSSGWADPDWRCQRWRGASHWWIPELRRKGIPGGKDSPSSHVHRFRSEFQRLFPPRPCASSGKSRTHAPMQTHTHTNTILRKGRRHVRWEPGLKDWAVESWSEDDETKVCARVGACRTCHQTAPMRRVFRKVELDKLPANVTDVFFVLSNHTTPTLERSQVWPKQEALSACTSSGRFPQASR